MPFNPLWGVGRENKVAGVPVTRTISDSSMDITSGANPPANTQTITIPQNTRIIAFSVTANPEQRNQNCVNGRLTITINEALVASYLTPTLVVGTEQVVWQVNEILPYSYEVWGEGIMKVTLEADNGGTTGYIMQIKISAIGYEF